MEKTFGDCTVRKQYSHIDLLHMIDGVEMQKATVAAGNRCYYLKVCVHVYTCVFVYDFIHTCSSSHKRVHICVRMVVIMIVYL